MLQYIKTEATSLKKLLTFLTTSILALATPGCAPQKSGVEPVGKQVPKHVLAFYYPWYGNPQVTGRWVHWADVGEVNKTLGNATHYPELGPYDSHDPQLIAQHFQWAAQIGLTVFIVSWWGQGTFEDQAVPLLLDAAQGSGVQLTVHFETVRGAPTPDNALADVLYSLQNYGSHPAWLKVTGKPVLFVYSRALDQIGLHGWQWVINETNQGHPGGALFIGDQISDGAARVFDGIHTYNPTEQRAHKTAEEIRAWAQSTFSQWIATASDRIPCVTIIPGYDDSKLGRPEPRPITDRWNGGTYRVLWEKAIAANPKWILITRTGFKTLFRPCRINGIGVRKGGFEIASSWNEWHGGREYYERERAQKMNAPSFLRAGAKDSQLQ